MSNIATIAYIILTLSVGYAFAYPSFGDLSMLMDEKQKYENTLDMVNNIEIKKKELLTEFNNISDEDKKNIDTILPSSLNFVKLISDIDAVAATHGIAIDKISLKETDDSFDESQEGAQPQSSYRSSVIGFSFNATYSKFNDFIDDLEKSLRILDIKSMQLRTQETGIYTYDVEFETYWLKSL